RASTTEDCLYLNVFTPNAKTARGLGSGKGLVRKRLPVMVWIHGGALAVGESDDYDPTKLVEKGTVVVSLNYRLGWLGFLAQPAVPGVGGGNRQHVRDELWLHGSRHGGGVHARDLGQQRARHPADHHRIGAPERRRKGAAAVDQVGARQRIVQPRADDRG